MSENLENTSDISISTEISDYQNENDNTGSVQVNENIQTDTDKTEQKYSENDVSQNEPTSDENKYDIEGFTGFLKELADKRGELEKEIDEKREYLSSNLVKYDSEDYFGNESFKELYTEAFNTLGTNLDTEKFVNLLDNYVNSRIESNSRKLSAQKENDNLTDSFGFSSGEDKKNERSLRFQDIPVEELEKYIAKYI